MKIQLKSTIIIALTGLVLLILLFYGMKGDNTVLGVTTDNNDKVISIIVDEQSGVFKVGENPIGLLITTETVTDLQKLNNLTCGETIEIKYDSKSIVDKAAYKDKTINYYNAKEISFKK